MNHMAKPLLRYLKLVFFSCGSQSLVPSSPLKKMNPPALELGICVNGCFPEETQAPSSANNSVCISKLTLNPCCSQITLLVLTTMQRLESYHKTNVSQLSNNFIDVLVSLWLVFSSGIIT